MNGISIVYLTNREDPCFTWFAESLALQWQGRCPIQIIVVDFEAQYKNRISIFEPHLVRIKEKFPNVDFSWIITPPKPTVWQGKYRLTTQDYFAASNARNTGIVFAKFDYVVFCDDLSVLMHGWLDNVEHAAKSGYTVLGSYRKVKDLVVTNGIVSSYTDHPSGHDSRWAKGSASGIVPAPPSDLFGCSFGTPLEALLKVNGLDEICDRLGGEDYLLGFALAKAGYKLFYNRNMMTWESEERHHNCKIFKRIIKPMSDGQIDDSHVLLRRAIDNPSFLSMGNNFSLEDLHRTVKKWEDFPIRKLPDKDWVDQQPLSEM